MLDTILGYLRTPLVVLSGTPISALTLLAGLAIVVCARIVAALLVRSLDRLLDRRGVDSGMRFAIAKIARYVVVVLGAIVALDSMGVNMSAVMAGGAVLLVGIGFGLQKLAENFISGLLLLVERPVRKGDFLEVAGVLGTVEDIGLRATTVITRDGLAVIVPNANLITSVVINHTVPTRDRRIWLKLGVAYGTDLERATRVLLDAAAAEPRVRNEPAPEVRHEGFGDSAIDLALVVWIGDARDELIVQSSLFFAIDRAFRAHAIEIPFPQRDVRLIRPAA